MSAESFVDTNVLMYAACGAFDYPNKHKRAWEIIGEGNYAVSAQVMAEFYVNSMSAKKQQVPLKPLEAFEWLERLSLMLVAPINDEIVRQAALYSQRFQISYWDASLIAAAETLDLKVLYTEDLNHGQKYGSVTAINPFKES
jgi:predicted nucleic acid-binding protein